MARTLAPSAINALHNPSSVEDQTQALKQLKNEIVGHDQRKELAITHGIVAPLARILSTGRRKDGKRKRETNGNAASSAGDGTTGPRETAWSPEEEMRLQAILVLGSLALAGPRFVTPLLNGNAIRPLLDALSPIDNNSKLVNATLRTLNIIADSLLRTDPRPGTVEYATRDRVYDIMFSKPALESFLELFSEAQGGQMEAALTAQLIAKCCTYDQHRANLVKFGVLDCLSARLIAKLPAAHKQPQHVSSLLEAIGNIVGRSQYRTARLLYSRPIVNLLPAPRHRSAADWPDSMVQTAQAASANSIAPDSFDLPTLHSHRRTESSAARTQFPQLGQTSHTSGLSAEGRRLDLSQSTGISTRPVTGDDFDSPLQIWLLHFTRMERGLPRLGAIHLLAQLKKFADAYPVVEDARAREKTLAYLLIPILLRMIEEAASAADSRKDASSDARRILEIAPAVFATLCEDSKFLQVVSIDAGAIQIISKLLKRTFDPVQTAPKPLWRATPDENLMDATSPNASSCRLGPPDISSDVTHVLRVRAGALRALSALAESDDNHRKPIIDTGVVAFVTQSLTPYGPDSSSETISNTAKDGNPVDVLIAACRCAMTLSRSVMTLRTSMLDHGLVQPVYKLLQHSNMDVQIAATDVLCNFMLEFSPMREEILEADAVKELCRRVHSANMTMRISALWALKHFVLPSNAQCKMQVLEEVGVGWLVKTLEADLREFPTPSRNHSRISSSLDLGTSNAAGERVSLLNAMDIDDDEQSSSNEEFDDPMDDDGERLGSDVRPLSTSRHLPPSTSSQIRKRLRVIKDNEQDPQILSHKDELRIQEQCLDLIRNLIADTSGGNVEMIDHVLKNIGRDRLFHILTSKLAAASPHTNNPHTSNLVETSLQPTELILPAISILNHIANGRPAHRAMLIAQPHILTALLGLFSHPDYRVRAQLLWTISSLTWLEDQSDYINGRQRIIDLRIAGFEERIRSLLTDAVLDVRERAKSCLEQMSKGSAGNYGSGNIGGGPGSGRGSGSGLGLGSEGHGQGGPVGSSGSGQDREGGAGGYPGGRSSYHGHSRRALSGDWAGER